MQYTKFDGSFPLPGSVIKKLVLHSEDFLTAWLVVCEYLLKMEMTEDFQFNMMRHQWENRTGSLAMAPRGIGKSFLLNTAFLITAILRDPNVTANIITAGKTQAKGFSNILRSYFEEGRIPEIFGDLRGNIWNEAEFCVKRTEIKRESTVRISTMGSSVGVISYHFDITIMDDVVSMDNVNTKKVRDDVMTYLSQVVFPTVYHRNNYGWLCFIGTHYHHDDAYARMIKAKRFKPYKLEALYEDKKGKPHSIWEKQLPLKVLLTEKDTDLHSFNMQYQQQVMENSGSVFHAEWVEYYEGFLNKDGQIYVQRQDEDGSIETERVTVYQGVDLAISQKTTADNFVIATIGIGDRTKYIYLLDLYVGKLSFLEQVEKIKHYADKWSSVVRIGIESVAYQSALANTLISNTNLPISKINTVKDKMTRFLKFSGQWENGKVFLYKKIKNLTMLENETLNFPNEEHDDTIDAFTIAWETSQKNIMKVITSPDRNIFRF